MLCVKIVTNESLNSELNHRVEATVGVLSSTSIEVTLQ